MKLIAEIDCGWIKCDICGDGRNYLVLRGENGRYGLERISECYPYLLLEDLTRDEMLEAIRDNRFVVSTQHALRRLKNVIRRIERERQVAKPGPKQHVGVVDPGSAWATASFWQDLPNFEALAESIRDTGRAASGLRLSFSDISQAFTWNDGATID